MAATMTVSSPGQTSPLRAAFNRFGVPALALLSSSLVVVALWRSQGLVDHRPDPYWFSAMAESLLRGEGFDAYGGLLHRRAPGYPFFLAGVYSIFGVHLAPVQVLQCLLFAGTCWLAQSIGRQLYNERAGLIAGLVCALHPSLLRYVPDLHLETLLTFVFTLSVWCSCRFFERATLGRAAVLGLTWGVSSLIKPVVLLYPGVFALLWLLSRRKRGAFAAGSLVPQLAPLALAFVVMGLTISPWTIRNYVVTKHFVPITTGASDAVLRSFVFSRYEFITLQKPPYTDAENEVNAQFKALCAEQGAVWEADDLQTDRILNVEAKRRVLAAPGEYVKKSIVGIFTFWYQMTSLKNSLAAGAMALVAWFFAGIGLWRSRRERQPVWLVLAPIVYLNLFLAALLSLGRYSVPVMPCLVTLAAFGVDTLLARFRKPATPA
jgi:4-amino-4-deoxy-L-arabinose transferase-like glycosyltransferase